MKHSFSRTLFATTLITTVGCGSLSAYPDKLENVADQSVYTESHNHPDHTIHIDQEQTTQTDIDPTDISKDSETNPLCAGHWISEEAVEQMLTFTEVTDHETVYSTYDRIDGIATLFEACNDPWGLFPTTYRHITNRIIEAIENHEIKDEAWGAKSVVDFAGRYLENLRAVLTGESPSYAWGQYYYLADRSDVSRTRSVVVAMVAHLTHDLPYALIAINTTEDHKDDYFVLGELMIEITPDFTDDLFFYYDTDAEDLLNGFFFGEWVDRTYGDDTSITLSYQTIRTKSWNNHWLLEQWWSVWIAEGEIYTAFWAIDGVLATLDAAGTI